MFDFSTLDHIRTCQDKDCKNEWCLESRKKVSSPEEADAFFRNAGASL